MWFVCVYIHILCVHLHIMSMMCKKAILIELMSEFSKVAGQKIKTQNSVMILYTGSEQSKDKIVIHLQYNL